MHGRVCAGRDFAEGDESLWAKMNFATTSTMPWNVAEDGGCTTRLTVIPCATVQRVSSPFRVPGTIVSLCSLEVLDILPAWGHICIDYHSILQVPARQDKL